MYYYKKDRRDDLTEPKKLEPRRETDINSCSSLVLAKETLAPAKWKLSSRGQWKILSCGKADLWWELLGRILLEQNRAEPLSSSLTDFSKKLSTSALSLGLTFISAQGLVHKGTLMGLNYLLVLSKKKMSQEK